MRTTRLERETTICFNDAEAEAIITSSSPVFIRKMKRLGHQPTPDWPGHSAGNNERWILPKTLITTRRGKRAMSEATRTALAAALSRRACVPEKNEAP